MSASRVSAYGDDRFVAAVEAIYAAAARPSLWPQALQAMADCRRVAPERVGNDDEKNQTEPPRQAARYYETSSTTPLTTSAATQMKSRLIQPRRRNATPTTW
jgi:hypothetical protein